MEIRKAVPADLDGIEKIYDRIHDGEERGLSTTGWLRGVYPTRRTVEDALTRGDLFVLMENGTVAAAAIINQTQVDVYKTAAWKHEAPDAAVMVLHTLTVDPQMGGRGFGRAFVAFYEDYARKHACPALRIDTNARNTRARKLYKSLGYEEIDIVPCRFNGIPDVQLVCLEKYLG